MLVDINTKNHMSGKMHQETSGIFHVLVVVLISHSIQVMREITEKDG